MRAEANADVNLGERLTAGLVPVYEVARARDRWLRVAACIRELTREGMHEVWTEWRNFPDPRRCENLVAPIGAGCYQLRRKDDGKLVLFGMSGHVALRMTSLLPKPYGRGTRDNYRERDYVLSNIDNLEYRTIACSTRKGAQDCERRLRANKSDYEFES